ncbi:hypothetical protein Clacol_007839 [Clathrus columnatus]|uniref:SAP domain-containing protein n=1 Tax=Clathrus columnatus TaxID=1419009 RepID=A0AAV5AKG7_9AGAM|nr:hypothetical protein Clacol_007839 [Clathrus columnatus]
MSTTFSGSIQSKKKSELQDIAIALDISDIGTREDLQNRIRQHLTQYEPELSEDPRFSGLFGRGRKRSAQPQMLMTIKEDVRSVTSEENELVFIKPSPGHATRQTLSYRTLSPPLNDSVARVVAELEPANVPLPITPVPSAMVKVASAIRQDARSLIKKAKEQEQTLLNEGRKRLARQKKALSHWVHIYAFTVITELGTIFYTSWPTYVRSDNDNKVVTFLLQAVALFRLQGPLFGYWLIPTLVLPLLFGMLVSFNTPDQDLDPVTIAIVRVACAFAGNWYIDPTVLGPRWRRLSACVHVAFAFAEAIGAKSSVREVGEADTV